MLEKEDLKCSKHQNQPICSINIEKGLQMNERLICIECMLNYRQNTKMLGLNTIQSAIENNIKDNIQKKISFLDQKKQQLGKLLDHLNIWKQEFNKTIDSIIGELNYWIDSLTAKGKINNKYPFIDELQNYINQSESHEKVLTSQLNKSGKLIKNQQIKQFQIIIKNIKESLLEIVQIPQPKITLKPISQKLKQSVNCWAIAFNYTGQIMISDYGESIKVWDFQDGEIQEVQQMQGHQSFISCLLFSKTQNSFISGSYDNTIRCWKQIIGDWKSSQQYKQHSNWIQCLLLCKDEKKLFSGSCDTSIKAWIVDFDNNSLIFCYSLMKHTSYVHGLSLNESETILVSCGEDKQIIVWKKIKDDIWGFQQIVIDGQKYSQIFN